MHNIICLLTTLLLALPAFSQQADLLTACRDSHLRLPAYPIITNDPYFSIWSSYDALNSGSTTHWTGNEKPIEGYLRVDGVTYRVMGAEERPVLEAVAPMADGEEWTASYITTKPAEGWEKPAFDDSRWTRAKGAFGTDNMQFVRTPWKQEHGDIYLRRSVRLSAKDLAEDLYMVFSHDDSAEFYINGALAAKGRMDLVEGERLHLEGKLKGLLHEGDNIIAVHCYNNTGGAYVDFGLYRNISKRDYQIKTARQISAIVMPTSTYYTFDCGKVRLSMAFTAPMLPDDYNLLSCPINYYCCPVKNEMA